MSQCTIAAIAQNSQITNKAAKARGMIGMADSIDACTWAVNFHPRDRRRSLDLVKAVSMAFDYWMASTSTVVKLS